MLKLTSRQKSVLEFIIQHFLQFHSVPCCRDICSQFEFRSPNAATNYLRTLFNKGYIAKRPVEKPGRGYSILRNPDGSLFRITLLVAS
ncbi:hypothetical protein KIH39_26345 [Telmatocola sphagniphila]|uniref:LexA repressor DNA-binding domain-containing protein n=1 Tax=Telmatocola sphagniphila TaxID=1123043 RepID=A0A8E6B550_9BACT|nr:hypothetical protein KIH39_26345 [Telmatocola sphagniphila]